MTIERARLSFALFACCCACVAQQTVDVQRSGNQIDVSIGGKPFTTYYFDSKVAKPYLHALAKRAGNHRDARISRRETKCPPGASTTPASSLTSARSISRTAISMGWISGVKKRSPNMFHDHGKQAYGHMVMQKIEEARGGDSGVIRAEFTLEDPSGRVIADETQAFTFRGDDQTRIIDCEFTVHATHGPVTFGDSKEGTFGIRVVKELDSPPAHMVNSAGAEGEKAIWGKRADWVNYDGKVEGEEVGIAVLDHPKSFGIPPPGMRAATACSPRIRSGSAISRAIRTRTEAGPSRNTNRSCSDTA